MFGIKVSSWTKVHWRFILYSLIVFIAAFSIKYVYLQERIQLPDFQHPLLDSKYHEEWATGLAFGEYNGELSRIRREPYFRAPLYPYFIAAVYRLLQHDAYTLLLVQILIGSVSALLMFLFTRAVFGFPTAAISIVIYLGYWPITYFECERLIPVLLIFLDLCLLLALINAGRKRKAMHWGIAGIFLGLSSIARPNILIVIPFIIIWIIKRTRKSSKTLLHTVFFLGAIAAVILPVTLRNIMMGNDLVLISSQGGVNFYIGNNPESNGVRAVVPGTRADWWGGFNDTNNIAEESLGRKLRPSEISRYWYKRGISFIVKDPSKALKLYLRKAILLFSNGEISNNTQIYFQRMRSRTLSALVVNFSVILSFSVLGLFLFVKRKRCINNSINSNEALLPYYLALPYAFSVLLFIITSRYRIPIVIFLIPGCAYGILCLVKLLQRRNWTVFCKYLLLVGGISFASLLNPFHVGSLATPRGYYSLGVSYTNTDLAKAIDAFDKSIAEDPTYAPAWKMRGWVYYQLDRPQEAISDLNKACSIDSEFVDAFFTLGVVLQNSGLHAKAGKAYKRVIELQPNHLKALNNYADVLMRESKYDDAVIYLRRALDIDSSYANSIYGMGFYYEMKGEFEAAISNYKQVLHMKAARLQLVVLLLKLNRIGEALELVEKLEYTYPNAEDIGMLRKLVLRLEKK